LADALLRVIRFPMRFNGRRMAKEIGDRFAFAAVGKRLQELYETIVSEQRSMRR
jgi:hypothetical protein